MNATSSSPTSPSPTPASSGRPLAHRVGEQALPVLAVGTALVAPVLVWNRLPDPVATHWGLGGRPDGSMPRVLDLLLLAAATVLIAVGPLVAARFPMPRSQARLLAAVAGFGSVLLASVRIAAVRANLDASTWERAGSLTGTTILAALGAGLVAGAIGWAAASSRPDLAPPTGADPAAIEVARVRPSCGPGAPRSHDDGRGPHARVAASGRCSPRRTCGRRW